MNLIKQNSFVTPSSKTFKNTNKFFYKKILLGKSFKPSENLSSSCGMLNTSPKRRLVSSEFACKFENPWPQFYLRAKMVKRPAWDMFVSFQYCFLWHDVVYLCIRISYLFDDNYYVYTYFSCQRCSIILNCLWCIIIIKMNAINLFF